MNTLKQWIAVWFAASAAFAARWRNAVPIVVRERFRHRRMLITLAITFTATFVAAATFRAEWLDYQGAGCTRTLGEAQTYEVVRDQAVRTRRSEHARLIMEHDGRVTEARRLLDRARTLRATRPVAREREAALLTIGAQLQFALARTIVPVLDFSDPNAAVLAAEDQLSGRARADLRETLLRKQCPRLTETHGSITPESFVDDLRQDIGAIQEVSHKDSLVALAFVFVLAFLTMSDYGRGRWSAVPATVAILAFVATVLYSVVTVDRTLIWMYFAAIAFYISTLLYILGAMVRRKLRATGGPAPRGPAQRPKSERLSFFVGLLVVATVLNAAAGTLYSSVKGNSNVDFADARFLELHALRRSTAFEDRAYATIDGMRRLREANLGLAAMTRLAGPSQGTVGRDGSLLWERDAIKWQSAMDLLLAPSSSGSQSDMLTPTLKTVAEGEYGPYEDPSFPIRFYVDRTIKMPAVLFAERDAQSERSVIAERLAIFIVGGLASFAIAVYLASEGLRVRSGASPDRRSAESYVLAKFGRAYLGIAVALDILAIAGYTHVRQPYDDVIMPVNCAASGENLTAPRDVAAALCFAAGEAAAKLHDNETAAILYGEAADLRPGFAVAHYLGVLTSIGNPPRPSLKGTVTAERQVMDDLELLGRKAAEPIIDNIGYHEFLLALETGDETMLTKSRDDTETAAKLDPKDPTLRYRRAVASLAYAWHALGRTTRGKPSPAEIDDAAEQAKGLYDDAKIAIGTKPSIASSPDDRPPSGTAGTTADRDRIAAAGALSDLELLRSQCAVILGGVDATACNATIDDFKEKVVAMTWVAHAPASSSVATWRSSPAVIVTPGGVGWSTEARRGSPRARGILVIVVASSTGSGNTYQIVPELSERVDPAALFRRSGSLSAYRSLLARSNYNNCLQTENVLATDSDRTKPSYAVEFYLNGKRFVKGKVAIPLRAEHFRAAAFREPGVAMCFPLKWQRRRLEPGSLSGSYRDEESGRGAMVHAFFDGHEARDKRVPQQFIKHALEQTLQSLGRITLAETRLSSPRKACERYVDGEWTEPHLEYEVRKAVAGGGSFSILTVVVKAWRMPDGLDVIGVVWQPTGRGDELSCSVLSSMTSIDRDVAIGGQNGRGPAL